MSPSRDHVLIERATAGETFRSIGASVGLSGERVRQIVAKAGLVVPANYAARTKTAERRAAVIRRREAKAALLANAIRMVAAGHSIRSVAAEFGVCEVRIQDAVRNAGVESCHGRWRSSLPSERAAAVDLYRAGYSKAAVSRLLGRSYTFVERALSAAGIAHHTPRTPKQTEPA